jgi:DNA primase
LQASYVEALRFHAGLMNRLSQRRGWPAATLTDVTLGIGYDARAQRITFPHYANGGELLVGHRRYLPGGKPKMLGEKGLPLDLYPPPETLANADELWILEGEPDVVSAHALGLWPACGVPGASAWNAGWVRRFRPYRKAVVCFDCDEPGRRAAERVGSDLAAAGIEVEIKDLAPGRTDGYDLGDLLLEAVAA